MCMHAFILLRLSMRSTISSTGAATINNPGTMELHRVAELSTSTPAFCRVVGVRIGTVFGNEMLSVLMLNP